VVRAVIANRDAAITRGVALLLEKYADLNVVAEVTRVALLEPTVTRLRPDVLLLGPRLGFRNVRKLIEAIRVSSPATAVVVLTRGRDAEQLREAIAGGVTACVSIHSDPEDLARTVLLAARGHVLISPPCADEGPPSPSEALAQEAPAAPRPKLSERENEVMELLIRGATNREIANSLFITNNTVKVHVRNILRKLGVRNRQQAAVYALQEGIIRAAAAGDSLGPTAVSAVQTVETTEEVSARASL